MFFCNAEKGAAAVREGGESGPKKKGVISRSCRNGKNGVRRPPDGSAPAGGRRKDAGAGRGRKTGPEEGDGEAEPKNEKLKRRRVTVKRTVFFSKGYH